MLFENQLDVNVKAFFFNAKTDYLPYYKNFSFTLTNETTLKELLHLIKEKNSDFSFPEKDLIFRVNRLVVTGEENVADIVANLGSELTIEPALKYRSDNGLILNNHDFIHNFRRVFKRHNESKEHLEYYLTLYPLHYASETFNYNHEYIGDAILVLAHKMVTSEKCQYKDEILNAINDEFNGIRCCEYENNIYRGEDHSAKIAELKEMIGFKEKISLVDTLCDRTLRKLDHTVELIEGSNIALYTGDKNSEDIVLDIKEDIKDCFANFVHFDMSNKLAGQTIIDTDREMAHKKAGTMLLDALDNGATILMFSKDSDLEFFKSVISKCERIMGREIELKLISIKEFKELQEKETIKV